MASVGARPDELRHLAAVLRRAVDEAAWLRRRLDDAQERSRAQRADTRVLARLEVWLADGAVDLRRRAGRLEDGWVARGGLMDDFHPPVVTPGGCGSVQLPVTGRRAEPGGGDSALGLPLFASAALTCAPPLSWSRDEALGPVLGPGGALILTSRAKPSGGGTVGPGAGGGTPSKRGRLKKAKLPTDGRFHFQPDPRWDPRSPIKWDKVGLGYVDAFHNVWRKGPSRTPGQPFEWDVQLHPSSNWRRFSKDGKHLNVTLDGRLSH